MERYTTRKVHMACDCKMGELLPTNTARNAGEGYLMTRQTEPTTFLTCSYKPCQIFKIVPHCDELARDDCRCQPVKLLNGNTHDQNNIYLPCFTHGGCCRDVTVTVHNAAALFDEPGTNRKRKL